MKVYVVNLPKDQERRTFQEKQLQHFHLDYEIINATSTEDISAQTYEKHKYDWQRPLRTVEVACYYSHQHLWKKIIDNNEPALILEDDALLSKNIPILLKELETLKNIDYINLEVVGRKKIISKESLKIPNCNSKLFRLHLDRNGTGGYILYPLGAKKLLDLEINIGIGLADAHINSCYDLLAYQIEPACIVQLDQCEQFDIIPPLAVSSNIGTQNRPKIKIKDKLHFVLKRIHSQLRQAFQHIIYILHTEKREIIIDKKDFIFSKNKDLINERS